MRYKSATRNRMWNIENKHQGNTRKVLALCSAGLIRSPTIAHILCKDPYNFNTRCAGLTNEYALIGTDDALLFWADDVIVVEDWMIDIVKEIIQKSDWNENYGFEAPNIELWDIPDKYDYMEKNLVSIVNIFAKDLYLSNKFIEPFSYCDDCGGPIFGYICDCQRREGEDHVG